MSISQLPIFFYGVCETNVTVTVTALGFVGGVVKVKGVLTLKENSCQVKKCDQN